MRKVCWHNWAASPAGDTCGPDGSNCAMVEDFQSVVCWHTGFRQPCDQPNKCRIDGSHCIILNNFERVVCHHQNFTDFGRPSNPNCNCTSVDGSNVKIVPKAGTAVPPARYHRPYRRANYFWRHDQSVLAQLGWKPRW